MRCRVGMGSVLGLERLGVFTDLFWGCRDYTYYSS